MATQKLLVNASATSTTALDTVASRIADVRLRNIRRTYGARMPPTMPAPERMAAARPAIE